MSTQTLIILGLLPLLKSIHKHGTLKKFAGQTIGIDAYGWLHRGTVACAIELALEKPTTKYVEFAMGRVRMLLDFGVIPYLVFDGDALPSKAGTNLERRKRRDKSKAVGLELYRAGKLAQAHQELQKAANVTPYMARLLIEELKKQNVQYLVAPYEADAQLVYLEQQGIINGILSEDSDMLVFGAKRLLTKLNQYGECVEIERADFPLCKDISLTSWSDAMFRRMAILSGCDYLTNIDKMGLKTAYRFVRKHKEAEKTIHMIQFEGKLVVPVDYATQFQQAEMTFLYHRVFSPIDQKLVFLNEVPRGMKIEEMPYLGPPVDAETAIGVACGDLDPQSKQPIALRTAMRPPLKEKRRQTTSLASELKQNKSLESFFTPRRQPLAELDPNSLKPSPSQQRLLHQYRNASWEPRTVSSAPQLRRAETSIVASAAERTDRGAFLTRAATVSNYQAPKRQRLCSDVQDPSPSKEVKQSPFFASEAPQRSPTVLKKARNRKAKKDAFDVWSDDSVDDVLLGLPEVQQRASPLKTIGAYTPESYNTVENREGGHTPVPQSSPADIISYPSLAALEDDEELEGAYSGATATTAEDQSADLEPFEDVLESHIRVQHESLLKSFVYQSPQKRLSALRSVSSPKLFTRKNQTYEVQSSWEQLAALKSSPGSRTWNQHGAGGSLAPAAPIEDSDTDSKFETAPGTPVLSTGSVGSKVSGSEDALILNSEDEGSELDRSEPLPTLNLKAYEYVQV